MAAKPLPLPTASGAVTDPMLGDLPTEITGITNGGAGSYLIHDGTDATGPIILAISGIGTVSLNVPVIAHTGVYAEVTGTVKGSLLL